MHKWLSGVTQSALGLLVAVKHKNLPGTGFGLWYFDCLFSFIWYIVNYCFTLFNATLCFNRLSNTMPNFVSLYKQWKEWDHYLSEKDKPKKTNKKCAEVSFKEDKFMLVTFAGLLSALTSCNSLKQLLLFYLCTSLDLRSNQIHKGRSLWSIGIPWI